jgi:hypothetical protein
MDAVMAGIVLGTFAGLLVGLIPLVVGARKDNLNLGIAGFFATALSGAILGLLLAVPIGGVFTWLACRNPKTGIESA